MFYCATHQVAYEDSRQFQGHWLHAHQGEPRPTSESVRVDQVPEGTKIADPPKGRSPRETPGVPPPPPGAAGADIPAPTRVATVERPPAPASTLIYADEEETHLDQLLDSIGVPLAQRQTIVKGWRNFPILHQHPGNLDNHIMSIVGPKFRGSVQLVVHAMFPGAEPETVAPQYMYGQPSYAGRPGSMFWPEQARWAGPPRTWDRPSDDYYGPRYPRAMSESVESGEPNPKVVALEKQVSGILEELKSERAERAQEKQERLDRERDAAWQGQLNSLATKVDDSFGKLTEIVKGFADQLHQGRIEGGASDTQRLAEEVSGLKATIADNRAAHLQDTVESLRGELAAVNQKVNQEPTGKTTEDLIASGIPLVVSEMRNIGNVVGTELKGIRTQAGEGRLPGLALPSASPLGRRDASPAPAESAPAQAAQQIVEIRKIENDILNFVGPKPRS